MAKKAPAKKAPVKRNPAAKKPTVTDIPTKPNAWRSWLVSGAKAAALIVAGLGGGAWWAGGIPIGPGPVKPDAVSVAFDQYETLWRAIQLETAKKLEAGEFTTSQQVTQYRSLADGEALKKSRQPLVDAEFVAFGGEKWTAEKAAKQFRSYAR